MRRNIRRRWRFYCSFGFGADSTSSDGSAGLTGRSSNAGSSDSGGSRAIDAPASGVAPEFINSMKQH